MNTGAEDKKKLTILIVVGVLALGTVIYKYNDLFGSSPAPSTAVRVAAPVVASVPQPMAPVAPLGNAVGHAAKQVGTASTLLDPTLKMGPMLVTEGLVYSGNGRNIFSLTSAPVMVMPTAIAPARPKGPVVPVVQGPVGPPPPPPIDLKFFGTATSGGGHRKAFLLHGDDVFLASDGDIVQRRYKVISVAANSIVVEDMTNNNRQTLPLLAR
jgi:hypothetical protein